MTTQDIGLFRALATKMDYLNQRHGVLAQNIANSDTPGYRPQDLKKVDFSDMVKASTEDSRDPLRVRPVSIARTDMSHVSPTDPMVEGRAKKQRDMYEVAPAGNAVIVEEQMLKTGQNTMDYNTMLNVYQKQVNMIRTAIGRS